MTEQPAQPLAKEAKDTPRVHTVQLSGGAILALVVLDGLFGSALTQQAPYSPLTLALHITSALITIGVAGHALRVSLRLRGWQRQGPAGLALASALGAAIAGGAFLTSDQAPAALHSMEALTGAIALAGVLLTLLGGAAASP